MDEEYGMAAYFKANRYMGKFNLGDRVFGHWNKIPFMGSVGNDSVVNEQEGPRVSIHLDLPIRVDGKLKTVIIVKPEDIKRLVDVFPDEPVTKTNLKVKKK
jgi:hypothetical protein